MYHIGKEKKYNFSVIPCFLLTGFFLYPFAVYAASQVYAPGSAVTIGEFIYDDNYQATTTPCSLAVFDTGNPASHLPGFPRNLIVDSVDENGSGWQHYTFTPPLTEGTYPAFISCGTVNVDLIREDKTFIVSSDVATTTIANAVWNMATTTYDTNTLVGGIVTAVNENTNLSIQNASSSLFATMPKAFWDYAGGVSNFIANIASGVWGATIAGLSDVGTIGGKLAQRMGDTASSIASLVNDHTDTVTGSLATTADVQNASSSVVALVNANTNSAVNGAWNVTLTDTQNVETGKTYKVKVYTKFAGNPTDSFAVPRITIKNVAEISVVNNDVMSDVGDGIYEYEYLAPIGAVQGSWETLVDVQVESLQYINVSDYWQVTGSPAQIIINSVSTTIPTITANMTITNEGLTGYEYQYEWCVVSDSNNACGGNDDIFHATAAKYVNSGTDFNTNITATVPTVGNYEFKAVVYFGTQSSRTSRSFTATVGTTPPQPLPGGGGGGGFINPTQPANPLLATFKKADFNVDGKVSSIDFSILMAFWNTKPPFKNIRVDITKDGKIDSVDFSILMYEWGS